MDDSLLTPDAGIPGLDVWSRCLLRYARCALWLPGRKSAFRKFRRRRSGSRFQVFTKHQFWMSGEIGDSVENQVAVFGEFESGLSRLIKAVARRTNSFVDLGCNIGYFSCLYGVSHRRGRILAVDANPRMAERCRENLRLNSIDARVLNLAAGDADGTVVLNVPRGRPTRGTLGRIDANPANSMRLEVQMRPLESILNQEGMATVELMKVDIEGYELKLFQSWRHEFAARFGVIVFEFSEPNLRQCGSSREDLTRIPWLDQFHLFALDETSGRLTPVSPGLLGGADRTLLLHRHDTPSILPADSLGG